MNPQFLLIEFSIRTWIINPFGYLFVILLGVEFLMPRLWNLVEYGWWKAALGSSSLGDELRRAAQCDFHFLIERQIESGTPRTLAVLFAVTQRVVELKTLTTTLRRRRAEMSPERFQSMIEELNILWTRGSNPPYLDDYVKEIEKSACDRSIDPELRLWGLCAVSVIKYALGNIVGGNKIGRRNWKTAQQMESDVESIQKWLASYGFFNSTLFLGQCDRAIDLMSMQWSRYYKPLREDEQRNLREKLFGKLILNPILAIPRHIILAFALAEIMPLERRHWPTESAFRNVNLNDPELKLRWFDSWSILAEDICAVEPISLSFTRAYGSFFLTLMLLEKNVPALNLHSRINEALASVDTSSAIVAQYTLFGFRGLYRLISGDDERAFEDLSNAATFSAISGNRFADFIFTCALAVAAARRNRPNRYLVPQVKRHMAQARQLANTLRSDLSTSLCDAAESAICLQFGDNAKAQQYAARSRAGRPESLLLRIFDVDALEPHKPFSSRLKLTA